MNGLLCKLPVLALIAGWAIMPACAQETNRSTLDQLNAETQSLYHEVQQGVVQIQLPSPKWINELAAQQSPLAKWEGQLDPAVRTRLVDEAREAAAGKYRALSANITSTTQQGAPTATPPATGPTTGPWRVTRRPDGTVVLDSMVQDGQGGTLMIRPVRPDGDKNGPAALRIEIRPSGNFAPNNFALVWDDKGHIVVPLAIEREATGGKPLPVSINGQTVSAAFVGSDRQTNLTVLKLDKVVGRPIKVGAGRPADGALVMVLSPSQSSARLMVWTGGHQDYGVVANTDGSIAGFARYGQFLSTSACPAVIDQLIKTGTVKRAALGVNITEVRSDDALRQKMPTLANKPAMRIDRVIENSAAAQAGLKTGDLILSLAGEPVGDIPTFAATIAARNGETELQILRDGRPTKVTVKLEAK